MPQNWSRISRLTLKAVLLLGVFFVGLQFVRPTLPNPPVTADLQAPPEVKQILRTACYNCHSNETHLSWFDWPVPAYWIVARDVKLARQHLNFSEIGKLPAGQQQGALFESLSQIELDAMPLPDYKRLHPESALSDAQIAVLKNYLHSFLAAKTTAPAEIAAADDQFNRWIASSGTSLPVKAAPNGISFLPDYKTWTPISSTARADNHTLRLILGNPVAIHAIAANQIHPWPDGTVFAKVAWLEQQQDSEPGIIRSGAFYQVEFMIKDSHKYPATQGWGWARWRGANLTPYGKDANFVNECVSCHKPVAKTDHVFTFPIRVTEAGKPS